MKNHCAKENAMITRARRRTSGRMAILNPLNKPFRL